MASFPRWLLMALSAVAAAVAASSSPAAAGDTVVIAVAAFPAIARLRIPAAAGTAPSSFSSPSTACLERVPAPAPRTAPLRFADATAAAGVRGARPQMVLRTSPNCLFDQWDRAHRLWDAGTFCIPELLTGGAAAGDLDGDGRDDLYVARLDSADSLFLNRGDGTFEDASAGSGVAALTARVRSNGIALLDVDNDGDLDVFISTLGDSRMYLLVNDGAGGFTEEAVARGVALARDPRRPPGEGGLTSSFSVAVGDFDNDGWLDLYTTEWFPREYSARARVCGRRRERTLAHASVRGRAFAGVRARAIVCGRA